MKLATALVVAVAAVPVAAQAAITITGDVKANYQPYTVPAGTTSATATGQFVVGDTAAGNVAVDNGSSFTFAYGSAGVGGAGSVSAAGAGTTLTQNAGTFTIGDPVNSTLSVTDGATANFSGLAVAKGAGSVSTVTLQNATLNVSTLYAAWGGTGTVNVNAGGKLTTTSFNSLSQAAGGTGTVNVSGAGAEWRLNGVGTFSATRVGYAGNGVINVSNGGRIINVGTAAGPNGLVFNYGDFTTGNGTINLLSGGTIDLAGLSGITRGTGTGTAAFNFTGGTLKNVTTLDFGGFTQAGGTFTAGTSTSAVGSTSIVGNYTLAGGTLQSDIASAASLDAYTVSGAATLVGTLNIVLANGFTPAINQSFNVLTAASINYAGLNAGGWGLSVTNNGGTQTLVATYVPEPASLAVLGLGALGVLARRRRA